MSYGSNERWDPKFKKQAVNMFESTMRAVDYFLSLGKPTMGVRPSRRRPRRMIRLAQTLGSR
jgi:hypothetical protein